jgi:hypothetical protein
VIVVAAPQAETTVTKQRQSAPTCRRYRAPISLHRDNERSRLDSAPRITG